MIKKLGKLFIAIIILAFAINSLSAQETTVLEIEPSGIVTEVIEIEPEPAFLVSEGLYDYVGNYFKSLSADGWNLKKLFEKDFFVVFDYEIDRDLDDIKAAGIALGMDNDDVVYVVINIDTWVTLEDYRKQDLINHELMHDVFNVKHTDYEERDRLMHPTSYPKNWGETMTRLVGAIHDLNVEYESE